MTRSIAVLLVAWISCAQMAVAQAPTSMYIELCDLGCTGGGTGGQVSCLNSIAYVNEIIRVRFSLPVDPASLNASSFSVVNVNTGALPIGSLYVDPAHPTFVVFEPSFAFDSIGNPVFGFDPNTTYRIFVPGVLQGDVGPFVQSTGGLDNQTRMQCDFTTLPVAIPSGAGFCFGDGNGTPCPCGSNGNLLRGCADSVEPHGAVLEAFGVPSLLHDTIVLRGQSMPNAAALYFQGTLRVNNGMGAVFGDGLRCVGGAIVRVGVATNANGWSTYPLPSQPSLSIRGHITAATTREYQVWFRDPAAFCTSATFNLTNGLEISWFP